MFAKFKLISANTLTAFVVAVFLTAGIVAATSAEPATDFTAIPAPTETPTPEPTEEPTETLEEEGSPTPEESPSPEESPTPEPSPYVNPSDPRPVPPIAAPTATPEPGK